MWHRLWFLLALLIVGCSQPDAQQVARDERLREPGSGPEAQTSQPRKIASQHLPNPVQVHPKVISGGLPEGDEAFAELKQLGVKTVISVDGAKPDVTLAKKYGLRYVHLPHGYDGVPDDRVKELAKAVRDLPGPVYIHCHHGKHRSPAAASVACVAAGLIPQADSLAVLSVAGTSPNYRGLYASAREAEPLAEALLDELPMEFPEVAEIPPMAEAMVALDHTYGHVQEIAAAGWQTPARHPDLDPAHEALLLREHFTELLRTDYVRAEPAEFQQILRNSEQAALALEEALRAWQTAPPGTAPPPALAEYAAQITADCKSCHEKYRDVPLGEK